jgi:hypothetical protein
MTDRGLGGIGMAGRLVSSATLTLAIAGCGRGALTPPEGLPPLVQPSVGEATSALESARWKSNDIPPRYQWNHNYGYCGEVSMISAGLYYGQYLSQYDARAAASDAPQNERRSQLLLGVNAMRAAAHMHLAAVAWSDTSRDSADQFLVWVKRHVVLGQPAAIGIYMNQYRFYHDRDPRAGSPQYDHIVPVVGIGSRKLGENEYLPDDEITFSDNGEWGSLHHARYFFTYRFKDFTKTRKEANAPNGPIYSLASKAPDFGIAVTGVIDEDHETIPVRLATSLNYELPQIKEGSSRRPRPEPLVLTVTVSQMKAGAVYNLYRYNRLSAIPNGEFNAHAAEAQQKWVIVAGASGRFVLSEKIESDEVAAYRAVPADGP